MAKAKIKTIKDDPKIERIKDILRAVLFFVLAWIIGETLSQANVVPEFFDVKVWEFVYKIPLRLMFTGALGAALSYIDRVKFIKDGKGLTLGN